MLCPWTYGCENRFTFTLYKWCAMYIFLAKDRQNKTQILNNFRLFLLRRKAYLSLKMEGTGDCVWQKLQHRKPQKLRYRPAAVGHRCKKPCFKVSLWLCLAPGWNVPGGCQHQLFWTGQQCPPNPRVPLGWKAVSSSPGPTGWWRCWSQSTSGGKRGSRWNVSGHLPAPLDLA